MDAIHKLRKPLEVVVQAISGHTGIYNLDGVRLHCLIQQTLQLARILFVFRIERAECFRCADTCDPNRACPQLRPEISEAVEREPLKLRVRGSRAAQLVVCVKQLESVARCERRTKRKPIVDTRADFERRHHRQRARDNPPFRDPVHQNWK